MDSSPGNLDIILKEIWDLHQDVLDALYGKSHITWYGFWDGDWIRNKDGRPVLFGVLADSASRDDLALVLARLLNPAGATVRKYPEG